MPLNAVQTSVWCENHKRDKHSKDYRDKAQTASCEVEIRQKATIELLWACCDWLLPVTTRQIICRQVDLTVKWQSETFTTIILSNTWLDILLTWSWRPEPHLSRRLPAEWKEQVAAAASVPGGWPSSARRYSGMTPRRFHTPARWLCTHKSRSCFSSSPWHCTPPRRRPSTPTPLRTPGPRASRCRRMLRPRRMRTPDSTGRRRGLVLPRSPPGAGGTSTCRTGQGIQQRTDWRAAHLSTQARMRRLRTATATKTCFQQERSAEKS